MATRKRKQDGTDTPIVKVLCAFDAMKPTEELNPHPRNPNRHPDAQIALLAKVISGDGWRHPITVSERSGFVIAGHGRLLAAQKLGLAECPVDYQPFESEADELAALVADNRLAELAEMFLPDVRDILSELDTGAMDMDMTGFDDTELERLMTSTPVAEDEPTIEPLSFSNGDKVRIVVVCPEEYKDEVLKELREVAAKYAGCNVHF
jgi:ParB-like chromosome segregation protein Spo0J